VRKFKSKVLVQRLPGDSEEQFAMRRAKAYAEEVVAREIERERIARRAELENLRAAAKAGAATILKSMRGEKVDTRGADVRSLSDAEIQEAVKAAAVAKAELLLRKRRAR
jgi:hypothetical protein